MLQRDQLNQLLVNELHHRARNLFSITEVILLKSLPDDPCTADAILGRLRSVHSANELMAATQARQISLKALLAQEFSAYGDNRLEIRGPEIPVHPSTARHLLLIFHELVTNAAKYGSLSRPGGKVVVQWLWNGGRRVLLTWKEIGGPEITQPTRQGFGSKLIHACVTSLAGTFEMNFLRDGFTCALTFRIADEGQ